MSVAATIKSVILCQLRAAVRGLVLPGMWPRATGFLRSAREGRSVDRDGNPVPWLTMAATDLLERRMPHGCRVLEWGAGASTAWFLGCGCDVVSIEHDAAWAAWVRGQARGSIGNLRLAVYDRTDTAYVDPPEAVGPFDVVLIDGAGRRDECASTVLRRSLCKPHGVVIVDNTNKPGPAAAIEAFRRQGWRVLPLAGVTRGYWQQSETSICYRRGDVLGLWPTGG